MAAIFVSITLSFAFNSWQERLRNKELEIFYLNQINQDLISDISELKKDKESYEFIQKGYDFYADYDAVRGGDLDSLDYYANIFVRETYPNINSAGFEILKSTGKLDIVSNRKVLQQLFNIYQEDLPNLIGSIDGFLRTKRDYIFPYFLKNYRKMDDNKSNLIVLLRDPQFKNLFQFNFSSQIIKNYTILLKNCETLQKIIENELIKAGAAPKKSDN
jgi:hypothetical protein